LPDIFSDEVLKIIKKEGDKQFARTLAETRKKWEEDARQKQRREELEAAAKRAEEILRG
jgi:hypothetical protein